jgi:hypothetical protein
MKAIWKYELKIADDQIVNLPKNAEILTVQNLNGVPCLWALVNPKNETAPRTILCRGTGHGLDTENCSVLYISSAQFYNGDIVFHYFEKLPI